MVSIISTPLLLFSSQSLELHASSNYIKGQHGKFFEEKCPGLKAFNLDVKITSRLAAFFIIV